MTVNQAGFCVDGLKRLDDWMGTHIEKGTLGGSQILLARHGEIAHWQTYGLMDREKNLPMTQDALFLIFSMTKPIVSAAMMTLYEQGRITLDAKVGDYLPYFNDVRVLEAGGKLVPPRQPITLRHLLTHTSGLTYGFDAGNNLLDQLYVRAEIFEEPDNDKFCRAAAAIPLMFHPGEGWNYSVATDVVGHLIEVITGKTLGAYLQETIFDPLGMNDTRFMIPRDAEARMAKLYQYDKGGNLAPVSVDDVMNVFEWHRESGGGGLVGSTIDYYRFCQMMLNDGELNGTRVLGSRTARLMHANHLPQSIPFIPTDPGNGFGLGFRVVDNPGQTNLHQSVGTYAWGGAAYTTFWIDPVEDLIAILMTQLFADKPMFVHQEFSQAVYAALAK